MILVYNPSHMNEVTFNELPDSPEVREMVRQNAEKSISFTSVDNDDKVLFIGGVCHLWGSVYEVWVFTTPLFFKKLKTSLADVHKLVAQMKQLKFARVQADVRADLSNRLNFVRHFGFREESVMEKYGPNGETYIRWVYFGE